jgi:hypothetical protein
VGQPARCPARRSRNRRGFEQKEAKEAKGFAAGCKTSGFATFAAFCSKSSKEDKKRPDSRTSEFKLVLLSGNFLFS